MSDHPPQHQLLCQMAKATQGWKVPAGPGESRVKKKKLDSLGGPNASSQSAPSQPTLARSPNHCNREPRGMGSEGRWQAQGPKASLSQGAPTPGSWLSAAHSPFTGKTESHEAQMSTALGQLTSDLWLLAHPRHHCSPSPYIRTPSLTQGSALPESSDFRKPGSELRGLIVNPTLSYPSVEYTAQP